MEQLFHLFVLPVHDGICSPPCKRFKFYSLVDSVDEYWFSRCRMNEVTTFYIYTKWCSRLNWYACKLVLRLFNGPSTCTSFVWKLDENLSLTSIFSSISEITISCFLINFISVYMKVSDIYGYVQVMFHAKSTVNVSFKLFVFLRKQLSICHVWLWLPNCTSLAEISCSTSQQF